LKILVTGFDPFGGEKVNPSFEAVKLLPSTIAGAELVAIEIPTVYFKGSEAVENAIKQYKPDVVLCVGQAGGRSVISVEKVAINLAEAIIKDNEGNQPSDQPLKADGENAYFTTVPVKAMVNNIRKHGIPANISYTAGTFVCNNVMYDLLYLINKKYPEIKGGFIHVPFSPEQVVGLANNSPSMPVTMVAKALEYAIEVIVTKVDEYKEAMGAID
jgi:pyroglutamyl-peptidase